MAVALLCVINNAQTSAANHPACQRDRTSSRQVRPQTHTHINHTTPGAKCVDASTCTCVSRLHPRSSHSQSLSFLLDTLGAGVTHMERQRWETLSICMQTHTGITVYCLPFVMLTSSVSLSADTLPSLLPSQLWTLSHRKPQAGDLMMETHPLP